LILVTCALYSFLGNTALLGPAVYIGIYSQEFGISPNTASGLISYANLVFGFGEHCRRLPKPTALVIFACSSFLSKPIVALC